MHAHPKHAFFHVFLPPGSRAAFAALAVPESSKISRVSMYILKCTFMWPSWLFLPLVSQFDLYLPSPTYTHTYLFNQLRLLLICLFMANQTSCLFLKLSGHFFAPKILLFFLTACVCVYIYIYTYIYIHTHIYTYIHMHTLCLEMSWLLFRLGITVMCLVQIFHTSTVQTELKANMWNTDRI